MSPTTEPLYNYSHFDFATSAADRAFWLSDAPALGTVMGDFELPTVEGSSWQLADHLGSPVVIETGSYTCPIFCGRIAAMDALADEFPQVSFAVIYGRETHPGERIPQHRDAAEKLACAGRLASEEGLQRTILVDHHDGTVHRALGANYNSVFVLDPQGRVVLRRRWNEPSDVRRVLADLIAGHRPAPSEATEMGSACDRKAAGVEMLDRGGERAVIDFARNAPPGIRRMLEASSPEVRRIVGVGDVGVDDVGVDDD